MEFLRVSLKQQSGAQKFLSLIIRYGGGWGVNFSYFGLGVSVLAVPFGGKLRDLDRDFKYFFEGNMKGFVI